MSTSELQSIIDENKEDIPDGVYLKLCNEMKKLHTKKQVGVYNLTLIKICKDIHNNGVNYYDLNWSSDKMLVRMPPSTYETIKDAIEETGHYSLNINDIPFTRRDLNKFDNNLEFAIISGDGEEYIHQTTEDTDEYCPYKSCSISFQDILVVKIEQI